MFGIGKRKKLEAELSELRAQVSAVNNQVTEWGGRDWSEFFSLVKSSAGVAVTAETAKRSSSVYACTSLIAGAVALLPLPIYERTENTRRRADHPLWWLLNEQPFPTLSSAAFWEWMVSSMLLRGDGIARIVRGGGYQPVHFEPLPRQCVRIERRDDRLIYLVNDGVRPPFGLDQADVLHFPGFGFNGVCGESVIQHAARQATGTALAADEYSGEFFANGATPSVTIEYPQGVSPTDSQQDRLRDSFEEKHTGSGKRHKPLVLVNGGKINPVTMKATDSQLIETRKFQVIDIARAFGVPPHMIGETSASTSWGSGIEQMSMGFVRYTLGPHLRRIEQELNRKLWPRSTKYFVEFNREGLLAGDSKTESDYFTKALGGPGAQGWMTVNDVRRIKNLEPEPAAWANEVQKSGATTQPAQGQTDEPDQSLPAEPDQAA